MPNLSALALALFCCCVPAPACNAQSDAKAAGALAELERGAYGQATPRQLEQAKAGALIPVLKDLFRVSSGPGHLWEADVPGSIASELVLLGDRDAIYWDFLVRAAMPAIETDQPDFLREDGLPGPSAAFAAWEKLHPPGPAGTPQVDRYAVQNLGHSGDPRAIPLLRRALLSPNSAVEDAAILGLGELHDRESLPFIVAALRRASPARAAGLAQTLESYFNDPAARSAAQPFLPHRATPAEQGQEVFRKLKAGEDSQALVEQLARAHVTEATPLLKSLFETERDPARRETLASVLVRFGVEDRVYWDYLAEQARPVVECDAPDWIAFDAGGKPVQSPEFAVWAQKHGVDFRDGEFLYTFAAPLLELAFTGDRRGLPLLAQALRSRMSVVRVVAVQGLAQIHDNEAMRVLLEASRRGPEPLSEQVAMGLIRFDDPAAQAEAARHQGKGMKDQWAALVEYARGRKPFGDSTAPQP